MQKLLISGFPKDTTAEEIREALEASGVPVTGIVIEPGSSEDRNVALVDVDTDATGMRVLTERLDGFVWKGHRLRAEHTLLFD
jgi:nucleoside-triphosphatase THEP1